MHCRAMHWASPMSMSGVRGARRRSANSRARRNPNRHPIAPVAAATNRRRSRPSPRNVASAARMPTPTTTSACAGSGPAWRCAWWRWSPRFFLHPRGRDVLDQWRAEIKREPLDAAAEPKARFDAADIALHPDRDLLAAPGELAFARQLPLLAWLDVAGADVRASDAVRLPVTLAPVQANTAMPAGADASLVRRARQWDALPARARGAQRGAWQAWRDLPPAERVRLRAIAARWQLLAGEERVALRARFDALPADARHGWWLGPELGRHWPRVAPLFAFAPEAQRVALLDLLARRRQRRHRRAGTAGADHPAGGARRVAIGPAARARRATADVDAGEGAGLSARPVTSTPGWRSRRR